MGKLRANARAKGLRIAAGGHPETVMRGLRVSLAEASALRVDGGTRISRHRAGECQFETLLHQQPSALAAMRADMPAEPAGNLPQPGAHQGKFRAELAADLRRQAFLR